MAKCQRCGSSMKLFWIGGSRTNIRTIANKIIKSGKVVFHIVCVNCIKDLKKQNKGFEFIDFKK